jgi:hypothetical protein
MARDLDDRETLDLIPQPKKRGRPKTGSAMTNAERQRKFRSEKIVTVTIKKDDIEALQSLVANPNPILKLDQETLKRIKEAVFGAVARTEKQRR